MQKHLTQAPQPLFAAIQTDVYSFRGFSYMLYSCLEGGKPASILLVQGTFYNSINF